MNTKVAKNTKNDFEKDFSSLEIIQCLKKLCRNVRKK